MRTSKNKSTITVKSLNIKQKKYAFNEAVEDVLFTRDTESIGESAFYGCKNLKNCILPKSLKKIECDAFSLCEALEEISLPQGLSHLGARCFSWSGIKRIDIPDSIAQIPELAFSSCSELTNVTIGNSCTEIGECAFLNCSELTEIHLPDTIKAIGKGAFKGCTHLKEIIIPDSVTILSQNAFENCRCLERITLPENLQIIEAECFSGCINLKDINFPQGLEIIEKSAFSRCEGLKTLSLPDSLTYLGSKAFSGCKKLTVANINASLQFAGASVFKDSICNTPENVAEMFCTSFLNKESFENFATVKIPSSVETLRLGFEGLLPYHYITENKTCYSHILELQRDRIKVFIGERYYNKNDKLIENGIFDFSKYDSYFESAQERERPVIAAFRLTYPRGLTKEYRKIYSDTLNKNGKQAAIFALESNEDAVLEHLLNNLNFDTDFYSLLYSAAAQKGLSNLQKLISQAQHKTGLDEINSLIEELML